jgi:hypothetical protein
MPWLQNSSSLSTTNRTGVRRRADREILPDDSRDERVDDLVGGTERSSGKL